MRNVLSILFIVLAGLVTIVGQNVKADEIVAKHLNSIGSDQVRSGNLDISIVGDVSFAVGSAGTFPTSGRCVLASEGNKTLFAMTFPLTTYPLEKVIWTGDKLSVAFLNSGARSGLGDYIFNNDGIVKSGLLGGVLNKGWTMSDLRGRNGKVSTDGTKKIDGREAYVVSYQPNKGSDLKIKLYFDSETFRHIRTEYSRTIAARMGARPELSSQQSEGVENLTEDFSDFKTENGMTLPRGYKISLYLQRDRNLREYRYAFKLTDIYYNQKLDPATFEITQK